jgi:2,5-furandicarboxylate decarboxylase 1
MNSESQDLRSFLRLLEQQRPADLVRVHKPVSAIQEPTALLRRLELEGRHPVVWFDKIGHSAIPLVMNVHATRERLALALGVSPAEINATYQQRIQKPIEPVLVSTGPVKEASSPDLRALPILTPSANTTAPYIGGGIVVARDPIGGARNLSYNRLMVRGPNRFTFHPAPGLHLHKIWQHAVARGEELPVAVILGYHPAFALGTLAKVPFGVDEYTCAGALLQSPIPLVRCRTVPLDVPANAEIVIEGRVLLGVLEEEGPYDEFTGYAMPATHKPVIQVTAITHRREPIFQDIMGGGVEHLLMGSIPKAATIEARLRAKFSFVRAVRLPLSGCGRLHAVVSVGPVQRGQVKELIRGLFMMDHFLKHAWVVDADVHVDSDREVLWAMSTTFHGDRDMIVESGKPGTDLDPSAEKGIGGKVGFDCTRKKSNFPPRNAISLAALEKMSPEQWIEPGR